MKLRLQGAAGVPRMIPLACAVWLALPGAAHADEAPVTPAAQASAALHLLEGGRYGEAIPAVQALVDAAPADPLGYQVRGTLEMSVGSLDAARQDFTTATALQPDNPASLYAQGLLQIWALHWEEAGATLARAARSPALSALQQSDLLTTQAYLAYLQGDLEVAGTQARTPSAGADPVSQELSALVSARTNPTAGERDLAGFLQTASGVPRVREDEGLHPLFDPVSSLEAAVTEPSLRRMYAASLRDERLRSDRQVQKGQTFSGAVILRTPSSPGSMAAAVTFTIDGQLAGMVNAAPYEYVWQTGLTGNGRHAVRVDALDAAGDILSTTTRQVSVSNTHPGTSGPGMAANPALEARVWNLLRLRPSRKVAEWTLGGLLAQRGEVGDARLHRAVAAALDLDYKDARQAARALFGPTGARLTLAARSVRPEGLRSGSTARKEVALTFDDGPNPLKTPALLDALDRADAPATFFVVGSRAEAAPDLVRRMAARGDDVENHSYTHPNMALTAPPLAESEILRTSVVIRALTGKPPRFFRPPGGQRNPVVYRLAGDYGQTVALWTIDALNYEEAGSSQGLIAFILKQMRPGAIVLMHNGMDSTIAAIPGLVMALRARGYQLVTLTQMTAAAPAVKAALGFKSQP